MPQEITQQLPPEADPSRSLPGEMDILVVNLDKTLLECKAKSVILPVPYGNLAVLSGHTPIFTKLVKGNVLVNQSDGVNQSFEIENGIAKITQFKVTILVGF